MRKLEKKDEEIKEATKWLNVNKFFGNLDDTTWSIYIGYQFVPFFRIQSIVIYGY